MIKILEQHGKIYARQGTHIIELEFTTRDEAMAHLEEIEKRF